MRQYTTAQSMAKRKQEMDKKSVDLPVLPVIRRFGALLTPPSTAKKSNSAIPVTAIAEPVPEITSQALSPVPKKMSPQIITQICPRELKINLKRLACKRKRSEDDKISLEVATNTGSHTRSISRSAETPKKTDHQRVRVIFMPRPSELGMSERTCVKSVPNTTSKLKQTKLTDYHTGRSKETSSITVSPLPPMLDTPVTATKSISETLTPVVSRTTPTTIGQVRNSRARFLNGLRRTTRSQGRDNEGRRLRPRWQNRPLASKLEIPILRDTDTDTDTTVQGLPQCQNADKRRRSFRLRETKKPVEIDLIYSDDNIQGNHESETEMTMVEQLIQVLPNNNPSLEKNEMPVLEKQKVGCNTARQRRYSKKFDPEVYNSRIRKLEVPSIYDYNSEVAGKSRRRGPGRPPKLRHFNEEKTVEELLTEAVDEPYTYTVDSNNHRKSSIPDHILEIAKSMRLTLDKVDENELFNIKINNPECLHPALMAECQPSSTVSSVVPVEQSVAVEPIHLKRIRRHLEVDVVLQGQNRYIQIPLQHGSWKLLRFGSEMDTLELPLSSLKFTTDEMEVNTFELCLPQQFVAAVAQVQSTTKPVVATVLPKLRTNAPASTASSNKHELGPPASITCEAEPTTTISKYRTELTASDHPLFDCNFPQFLCNLPNSFLEPTFLERNSTGNEVLPNAGTSTFDLSAVLSGQFNTSVIPSGRSSKKDAASFTIIVSTDEITTLDDVQGSINRQPAETIRNILVGFQFKVPPPPRPMATPRNKASDIRNKTNNVQIKTSDIRNEASDIQEKTSDIRNTNSILENKQICRPERKTTRLSCIQS